MIRQGARGPEVADVQRRLAELGYSSDDDPGVFGGSTLAAVRTFQQERGLVADGIVGDDTWRAMVEASVHLGDRNLYHTRPMLRGDDVRDLQERLNRLGFDAGPADGVLGPDTEAAIRDFQANVGVAVDGIAGDETIRAIRRLHRAHQSQAAFSVREKESMRYPQRATLAGARVLLDPGHGPEDPGYLAPDGTAEHQLTWAIANRLAGRLLARGVSVLLSRGPNVTPSVSERARLANEEDVDAVLGVHLNGLDSPHAHGAAAYYFGHAGIVSEAGRTFAQLAVDEVCNTTGALNCRCHASRAGLLRETRAPAVIVEPGFLTHPEEGQRLRDPAYQDRVAAALSRATCAFLLGGARPMERVTPRGASA